MYRMQGCYGQCDRCWGQQGSGDHPGWQASMEHGDNPDGKKLYVANGRSGSVSVIDTAARQVIKEISVGEAPWGVVIQ